jgi:hypothetical protein
MTSAVRHPVSARESTTQSQRSAGESRNRRRRERCGTCSWCRQASTSSWSAARDGADVLRVRRSATSTDIIAQQRPSSAATSTVSTRSNLSVTTAQTNCRRYRFMWRIRAARHQMLGCPLLTAEERQGVVFQPAGRGTQGFIYVKPRSCARASAITCDGIRRTSGLSPAIRSARTSATGI